MSVDFACRLKTKNKQKKEAVSGDSYLNGLFDIVLDVVDFLRLLSETERGLEILQHKSLMSCTEMKLWFKNNDAKVWKKRKKEWCLLVQSVSQPIERREAVPWHRDTARYTLSWVEFVFRLEDLHQREILLSSFSSFARSRLQSRAVTRSTGNKPFVMSQRAQTHHRHHYFLLLLTFPLFSGAQQSSSAELIVQRCPAGVLDETQRSKNKNVSNQKGTHPKQSAWCRSPSLLTANQSGWIATFPFLFFPFNIRQHNSISIHILPLKEIWDPTQGSAFTRQKIINRN